MERYHYTGACLNNIYLLNGFTEFSYGEDVAVSVDNVEGLHRAIATAILNKSEKINASEIRFLRTEMDIPQTEMASLLGIDVQTLATWERGLHNISGPADRLFRMLANNRILNRNSEVGEILAEIASLSNQIKERLVLQETENGWQEAAEAA